MIPDPESSAFSLPFSPSHTLHSLSPYSPSLSFSLYPSLLYSLSLTLNPSLPFSFSPSLSLFQSGVQGIYFEFMGCRRTEVHTHVLEKLFRTYRRHNLGEWSGSTVTALYSDLKFKKIIGSPLDCKYFIILVLLLVLQYSAFSYLSLSCLPSFCPLHSSLSLSLSSSHPPRWLIQ